MKVRWPSPAMAVALLALFVAMGGSVYAANQINGKSIKKNSLPGNRVKKNSLAGNRVKKNSLPGNKVKKNSLVGSQINESTLGTVPSATKAADADHATNADHATGATTANSPVAWAHVDSSGALLDGSGIAQANIVEPYADGEYCFKNLGFAFKSLQASVDARDNGNDKDVTIQVAVGDPLDCEFGTGGAGTQAGVVTGNGSTTLPKAGFFVWFFN
jgi:hypothetical protein